MEKWNNETKERIEHSTWDFMHELIRYLDMVDVHTVDLICEVWEACQNLVDNADYTSCSNQTDTLDLERMRVPRARN